MPNSTRGCKRYAAILLLVLPLFAVAQEVALTFDDLPAHGPLPPGMTRLDVAKSIISTLKAGNVPQVYGFVNAARLDENPKDRAVLEEWRAAGFMLGNHTYSHMSLTDNSVEAFEKDIAANEPVLQSLMGSEDWHWFRYPFLWEGETLEKRDAIRAYLKQHGYRIAQVTLDFEDYAWNPPYARCVAKNDQKSIDWLKSSYLDTARQYIELDQKLSQMLFGRNVKYVFLLHIGGFQTVMLPQLLDLLKQKGFRFVTLPEAESDPAYQSNPNAGLKYGGTLLEQMIEAHHLKYPPMQPKPMKELSALCQ